eukprot:4740340-Alexandrium_andersonii.AAC.1
MQVSATFIDVVRVRPKVVDPRLVTLNGLNNTALNRAESNQHNPRQLAQHEVSSNHTMWLKAKRLI